jgi:DNA-binding LytR/AlgR family response regulator
LLKPFDFERFLVAVTKVRTAQEPVGDAWARAGGSGVRVGGSAVGTGESGARAGEPGARDFVFINVQKKRVKIFFSDIVYIESQREYIKITTTRGEYISKMSTHETEEILPVHLFKRVHRSFIVSIRRIESYTAEVIEINGVSIPIGKGYRDGMENL